MEQATISQEELEEFRAYKAKKEQEANRKALREEYNDLVDTEIEEAYNVLSSLSYEMAKAKQRVFDSFRTVIEMKTEQMGLGKGKEGEQ